ncbi:MAG: hypothetical protein U5K72_17685 [Balneolaceae bacterium]|nr:hypothetical protein [Balneolaceae bacterium]
MRAHKSLATTYSESINYLTKANVDQQLIGLTATPGRTADDDIENKMLANFFRSNKITLTDEFGIEVENPIKYLQDIEILAKLNRRSFIPILK